MASQGPAPRDLAIRWREKHVNTITQLSVMEGCKVPWESVVKCRRPPPRVCPGKSSKALWKEELARCERLWVRGKRNGPEHAVKRQRGQGKLVFLLDLPFTCAGMR